MKLFPQRDYEEKGLCVIVDETGIYPIDSDYRDTGISEGWLKRTGYYYDHNGQLVWTYVHISEVTPE